MKKFNKVCLILAAVFAVIGIGFVTAGIATGATWQTFREAVYRGDYSVWPFERVEHWSERFEDDVDEWADGLADGIEHHVDDWADEVDRHMDDWDDDWEHHDEYSGIVGSNGASMSMDLGSIRELEVELKYGDVIIEPSKDSRMHMKVENVSEEYVTWYQEEDSLEIKGNSTKLKNGQIYLYVPEGKTFHEISIHMDAGAVTVDDLAADKLDVQIGAGAFYGNGAIAAAETDWEVGAGEIIINELKSDKIELDCGVGDINLSVDGRQKDYNYEIKCGLGEVSIGDESYTALDKKKEIRQSGISRKIEANCGMGQIDVQFLQ